MVQDPEYLLGKIKAMVGTNADGQPNLAIRAKTAEEAKSSKSKIIQVQRELRALKRESNGCKKEIRSSYTAKKADVRSTGTEIFFGKKSAGQMNAAKKEDLRREQALVIAPYDELNHMIDDLLLQMDAGKREIDEFIAEQKSSATAEGIGSGGVIEGEGRAETVRLLG